MHQLGFFSYLNIVGGFLPKTNIGRFQFLPLRCPKFKLTFLIILTELWHKIDHNLIEAVDVMH